MAMALPCQNPIKKPSIASQLLPCQDCQTTVVGNLTVAGGDNCGLKNGSRSPYLQCTFTAVARKYYFKSFSRISFFDSCSIQQLFVEIL
jgi:hypothetical protein